MTTLTRLITAEELLQMPDDGQLYELVRGELRPMSPPADEHGDITNELNWWLSKYVREHRLGKVYAAETGYRIARDPDTVRAADVSFIRRERLTPRQLTYRDYAPDLVAEVISPTDIYLDVEEKVQEWLAAGVRMVLVVNPRRRTVTVHHGGTRSELAEGQTLDGADVVPGWTLPVAALFSEE